MTLNLISETLEFRERKNVLEFCEMNPIYLETTYIKYNLYRVYTGLKRPLPT